MLKNLLYKCCLGHVPRLLLVEESPRMVVEVANIRGQGPRIRLPEVPIEEAVDYPANEEDVGLVLPRMQLVALEMPVDINEDFAPLRLHFPGLRMQRRILHPLCEEIEAHDRDHLRIHVPPKLECVAKLRAIRGLVLPVVLNLLFVIMLIR